jgi:hypothetical protein
MVIEVIETRDLLNNENPGVVPYCINWNDTSGILNFVAKLN